MLNKIEEWNECYLYKSDEVYSKYLYLLELLHRGTEMEDKMVKQVIEAGLERTVSTISLVRTWAELKNA